MLQLDIYMMIEKGISHKKVSLLCEACGLEVLEINKESLKVKMPEIDKTMLQSYEKDAKDKNKNDLRKPRTYVSFLIEEDSRIKLQDEEKIRLESTDNETRLYMKPKSKIEIASKLMYAETNGSNTAEVSKLPFIDTRRTYSNDFYEIYRLYGVEAIRQYLIRDLDSVIKEGRGFVLMKHIGLLMDYMTNLGTPLAISYTGMSMQGKGTLASASYERPMEIFLRGAGKGRTENINSVSASIFTGKTAKIGTGFMEVLDDTATASELDKYMDNSSNVFSTIEDLTNVSEKELYEWDFEKEDDNEEDK
jgi:DNA-directed RNA polymerase beta' subunit